jgi:hypothetical protein
VMSRHATMVLLNALLQQTIGGIPDDAGEFPTPEQMKEGGDYMERTFLDAGLDYDAWVEWSEIDAKKTVTLLTAGPVDIVSTDTIALILGTQLTQGFLMGIELMKWKADQGGAA